MTKPSSASGVTFRSIDDLFEPTDGSADRPQLAELDVDSLVPFKDHPFREYPEEKMQEMVESVTEHGILMPMSLRSSPPRPYPSILPLTELCVSSRRAITAHSSQASSSAFIPTLPVRTSSRP